MLQHEEGISSAVADWVDQLGKRGTVDLGVWSQYLTLDVSESPASRPSESRQLTPTVELVTYGDRKGFIERGEDLDGYIKTIDVRLNSSFRGWRSNSPNAGRLPRNSDHRALSVPNQPTSETDGPSQAERQLQRWFRGHRHRRRLS